MTLKPQPSWSTDFYKCSACGGTSYRYRLASEDPNWPGVVKCGACKSDKMTLEKAGLHTPVAVTSDTP